jgi:hypothetical protein
MQYEEPDKEELEDLDHSDDLKSLEVMGVDDVVSSYDDEDYDGVEIDVDGKSKGRSTDHESLKARRALEERLANKQLRKELDYLYDDGFMEEEKEPE